MYGYANLPEVIRDRDGNAVRRSRNLRGIREFVGKHRIKHLTITPIFGRGGKLWIIFEGGFNYDTTFASYEVLRDFVRRWRNVYGAPLYIGSQECGVVSHDNPALKG